MLIVAEVAAVDIMILILALCVYHQRSTGCKQERSWPAASLLLHLQRVEVHTSVEAHNQVNDVMNSYRCIFDLVPIEVLQCDQE